MMKVTPEVLAQCLADVESGRMTVEQCVAEHLAVAEELRSLLLTADAIPSLPPVTPDPAFRLRGRTALIAAINAEQDLVTRPPFQRFWKAIIGTLHLPTRPILQRRMGMPAVIIALVMALVAGAGGGAVYASQEALPGDALYQVKTATEGLQLTLAAGDVAKAEIYLDLAAKRLAEVQKGTDSGNVAATTAAAEAYTQDVAQANQLLTQAASAGQDVSKLAAQLADNLSHQQQALVAAQERAPEQAKDALAAASKQAGKGLTTASSHLASKKTTTAAAEAEATSTPTSTPVFSDTVTVAVTVTPTVKLSGTLSLTLTQTNSDVQSLANDPKISGQSYDGLLAKLNAVQAAIARGQTDVAVNILNAFLNQLNAFQNAGHISDDNYDTLYASYQSMVSALGGTPKLQATKGKSNSERPNQSASSKKGDTPEATETPESAERPDRDANAKSGGKSGDSDDTPGNNGNRQKEASATPVSGNNSGGKGKR